MMVAKQGDSGQRCKSVGLINLLLIMFYNCFY